MFLCIIPQHIYDNGQPWEDNPNIYEPIGTGPFKFDSRKEGEFVKFVRYDDYHKGKPYLDGIVWQIIPDVAVAVQMLMTDEIQIIGAGSVPSYSELVKLGDADGVRLARSILEGEDIWAMEINSFTEGLPFYDVNVRKALSHAIDKDEIIDKVFQNLLDVSESMFTKDIPWAHNPNVKYPAYNVAEAERLLDEAGYPRGSDGIRFKTNIEIGNFMGAILTEICDVLVEQFAAVGIDAGYSQYEWLTWYNKVKGDQDFELSVFFQYASPDPDIVSLSVMTGGGDNAGYSSAAVDDLLDQARKATDKAVRGPLYHQVHEILVEDLPWIPLADHDFYFAVRDDYHDFWFDPGTESARLNPWTVWWEGGEEEGGFIDSLGIVGTLLATATVAILISKRRRPNN
jgi:peptide/nickel transport system substrate-binding protein